MVGQRPFQSSLVLSVTSGLLAVLVFPKFNTSLLSAVAFVPLLISVVDERNGLRRFFLGWVSGSIFFAGTCYWIDAVMRQYGGLGAIASALVFVLFFVAFACYWGLFAYLTGLFWNQTWGLLAVPFLWIAIEYLRTYLITGFPWLLLGYALTDYPTIAWIARWTGVYGLSFLLIAMNVGVVSLFLRRTKLSMIYLVVIIGFFIVLWIAAPAEIYREDETAYLVQTNISEEVAYQSWDEPTQSVLLHRLESMTVDSITNRTPEGHTSLIIWPEMPAPFYFEEGSFARRYAQRIAEETKSYFQLGIVAYVPGSQRSKPLNSTVLLDPSGEVVSQYDKIHLVPFGEYVPLKQLLQFADKLTAEAGDFVSGERHVVSKLNGGTMSGFICYEAIFPDLVRRFVKDGAEVLVNTSNDGWFGNSAARYQHFLIARMRAIENRRYLLRATNNGITAVIRPDGRIARELPPDEQGVLDAHWSFLKEQTFYTQHGDVFAMSCCTFAVLALGLRIFAGSKVKTQA